LNDGDTLLMTIPPVDGFYIERDDGCLRVAVNQPRYLRLTVDEFDIKVGHCRCIFIIIISPKSRMPSTSRYRISANAF
jgi:hypothetical protein